MIRLQESTEGQVVVVPCKIAEDYPAQIDASMTKQEIYMIAKSENSSNLHIYGFDRKVKKTIRDAVALSVSTDEKTLAYANTSAQVRMIFIKSKLPDAPSNISKSPSKKITKQMSAKMAKVTPDNVVDEKVINTIDL